MKTRIGRTVAMVAVAVAVLVVAGRPRTASAAPGWITPTVATVEAGAVHIVTQAIDGQGNWHILYYDTSQAALKYVKGSGATVSLNETVPLPTGELKVPSIAVDSNGRPHIAVYESGNDRVHYARRSGQGTWLHKQVATEASWSINGNSIAVDALGSAHLVYRAKQPESDKLMYARVTYVGGVCLSGCVTIEDVGATTGSYHALALDASGTPTVAYTGQQGLKTMGLARRIGGAWVHTAIPNSSIPNSSYLEVRSIAASAQGAIVVAALEYSSNEYHLFNRTPGGAWTSKRLDSAGYSLGTYGHLDIAVDAQGDVHAGYTTSLPGSMALRYAKRTLPCSLRDCGTYESVTPSLVAQYAVSLALSPSGTPQIAFVQQGSRGWAIKLALRNQSPISPIP